MSRDAPELRAGEECARLAAPHPIRRCVPRTAGAQRPLCRCCTMAPALPHSVLFDPARASTVEQLVWRVPACVRAVARPEVLALGTQPVCGSAAPTCSRCEACRLVGGRRRVERRAARAVDPSCVASRPAARVRRRSTTADASESARLASRQRRIQDSDFACARADEAPPGLYRPASVRAAWTEAPADATAKLRTGYPGPVSPSFTPPDGRTRSRCHSVTAHGHLRKRRQPRGHVFTPTSVAPWGLIVTQTATYVEEGKPKRPWMQIAPVYELYAVEATAPASTSRSPWIRYLVLCHCARAVSDGRVVGRRYCAMLVPASRRAWLVGRECGTGYDDPSLLRSAGAQLAVCSQRTAHARAVVGARILSTGV
jgi:hypothetical protein